MDDRKPPIVVSEEFNRSASDLWTAITDPNQMVQWFFHQIPDFIPEVGFETRFNVNAGERDFMHQWKILEVDPGKRIVYDWSYEEYPGRGEVVFEVEGDQGSSKLTLTNTGLDTFPSDLPEFTRESCIGGWNYFIKENLKSFLEGS